MAFRGPIAVSASLVVAVTAGLAAGCDPDDVPEADVVAAAEVAEGVTYEAFGLKVAGRRLQVHLISVDLADPGVAVDVLMPGSEVDTGVAGDPLRPGTVADTARTAGMARQAGAVAAVNGDLFNNKEDDHPEESHTDAPVGPVIAGGMFVKSAVPQGQAMGPSRHGAPTEAVLGITEDGEAQLSELDFEGFLTSEDDVNLGIDGLNQYGVAENGIGVFNSYWGSKLEERVFCGADDDRHGPCDKDALLVKVRDLAVVDIATSADANRSSLKMSDDETLLVARGESVDELDDLSVGDRVGMDWRLAAADETPYAAALGGIPIVQNGERLGGDAGLDDEQGAVRTAAGYVEGGRVLYLAVVSPLDDGDGLTLAQLADFMIEQGAHAAVNLDGGGSSTMAVQGDSGYMEVRNDPTHFLDFQRPVANALGVFSAKVPVRHLAGVWESEHSSLKMSIDPRGHVVIPADDPSSEAGLRGTVSTTSPETDDTWWYTTNLCYWEDSPSGGRSRTDCSHHPGYRFEIDDRSARPAVGDVIYEDDDTVWTRTELP